MSRQADARGLGAASGRPGGVRLTAGARLAILAAFLLVSSPVAAQLAHHPFAIGANEGAVGHQNALGAWLIAQESYFSGRLASAVRATQASTAGYALLVGLSFAYGVFHAAGPGHGKAVITSYMVSNEVALRRSLAIALAAALLQGTIAIMLVGAAVFVFHATAARMNLTAQVAEIASYLGVIALGLSLVWRKGRALVAALRPARAAPALLLAPAGPGGEIGGFGMQARPTSSRFFADDGSAHLHGADCECGHSHMPDPALLGDRRFDWKAATLAVATAGARPCSGAILVLVFAAAQGVFATGVAAAFAMAGGTAITTGALATVAVFAKGLAMRLTGGSGTRAAFVGRLVEFGAAACVLVFGIVLLAAAFAGPSQGA